MKLFDVTVRDRIAVNHTQVPYVCGNTDYKIRFEFDAEWETYTTKTARFVWGNQYHDEVFTGNECPVPKITDVCVFEVGVFAGDLQTTTPAGIPAKKSILCGNGSPADPSPNVYDQVMETLNENTKVANGTAAELKEAFGNSGLYIVTAAPKKEGVPVLYADKTQAEIREAVAAGKTCMLVYHADTTLVSAGTVCLYFGEGKYDTSEAESPSFFAGVKYDTRYSLWYQYVAYVRADGHVGVTGNPIKTPAPQKLKFTGAVEAEFDGSKQVTVEIPSGGAGLPETAAPLKQLVTDADGKVAWEDRVAYKYTSTQKGYINVYQDAEMVNQDGQYMLLSPPASSPVAGETYTIIIGGNEYTSKCVDFSAIADGQEAYVFGNTAIMGDDFPFENPVPDATYLLMLIPGGSVGYYGMVVSADPVDSPVLTIRSVEEVETTTTNIQKVDRELLDIPSPDMNAGYDEEGYIANRPCWVYETQKGGIVWDGVIEGKEALYMTMNGTTQLLGYKVCPVPMDEHTFVNKLRSWSYAYPYNEDGSSAGTKKIINQREFVTYGLHALKQNTGGVLYYSYVAESTGDSLATFSGGGTGIYITPEFAATAPRIEWVTGYIYKPLDKKFLPPARTDATATTTVYYWRWNPSSGEWQAVTIDQLKADFGFVDVVATADGATITAMSMSFDEVNAAVQAGKNVRLKVGAGWMHCSHSTGNEVEFYTIMGTMLYRVIYRKDGTATVHQHALVAD